MTEQVNNFQNQAKKLPKALRDWQAFVDCKKVIDDFLEELPLFQQLASKAMRPRYVQSSPNLLFKYYCSMPHPVDVKVPAFHVQLKPYICLSPAHHLDTLAETYFYFIHTCCFCCLPCCHVLLQSTIGACILFSQYCSFCYVCAGTGKM